MIKKILIPALAALLFISCSSGSDSTVFVQKDITTTFMVYLPGTDLETNGKNATLNLNAMLSAESANTLNVVVQTGAANIDYTGIINPPESSFPVKNWKRVKRHDIKKGIITERQDLGKSCLAGTVTTDCIEMGTPEALSDFIRYSVKNYPADRYIIVFWDHGMGPIGGYGKGDVATMDMSQIVSAFDAVKNEVKFDIIGFDTCDMGSLEIAYNLRHYAKYMVASEEMEGAKGWDYAPPLTGIAKNPNISDIEIGKLIIDSFHEQNKSDPESTLAMVDLSKTEAIVTALDSFSLQMSSVFKKDKLSNWLNIFGIRSETEEFDIFLVEKSFKSLIDIVHFSDLMKYYYPNDYAAVSTTLTNAAKNAVVYNRVGTSHALATGLSMYFPFHFGGKPASPALQKYNELYYSNKSLSFASAYKTLLTELLDYADKTPTVFTIGPNAVASNNVLATVANSTFGIDNAMLLVDTSTVAGEYKFFISSVAYAMQGTTTDYTLIAKTADNILAINDAPVYMELVDKFSTANSNVQAFEVPLYVTYAERPLQPQIGTPGEPTLTMLIATYNFKINDGSVEIYVKPQSPQGRSSLPLIEGDVITFPEVIINATTGEKTIKPTTKTLTLGKNGSGLKIGITAIQSGDKLAFYARDLKGTPRLSGFFKKDGTPIHLLTRDSGESLQTIADALNSPLK